jgi:hypothetical protein
VKYGSRHNTLSESVGIDTLSWCHGQGETILTDKILLGGTSRGTTLFSRSIYVREMKETNSKFYMI